VSDSGAPDGDTKDVLTRLDRELSNAQNLREQDRRRRERRSFYPDRRQQDIGHVPDRRRHWGGE
jgi:hypothetical protein